MLVADVALVLIRTRRNRRRTSSQSQFWSSARRDGTNFRRGRTSQPRRTPVTCGEWCLNWPWAGPQTLHPPRNACGVLPACHAPRRERIYRTRVPGIVVATQNATSSAHFVKMSRPRSTLICSHTVSRRIPVKGAAKQLSTANSPRPPEAHPRSHPCRPPRTRPVPHRSGRPVVCHRRAQAIRPRRCLSRGGCRWVQANTCAGRVSWPSVW